MLEKIKMLLDIFWKITAGVLIAAAVYITAFWGMDCTVSIRILWQILAVSAACSLGILMYPSNSKKEISKSGMLIRQIIYFVYVNVIVLGMGNWFGWFSFQNWKMVFMMEALIVGVFILVNIICYLNDYAIAKSMNDKLAKKRS